MLPCPAAYALPPAAAAWNVSQTVLLPELLSHVKNMYMFAAQLHQLVPFSLLCHTLTAGLKLSLQPTNVALPLL